MNLYLVELTAADWPASLAWYRDLGLAVELLDESNRYALLAAGPGRIALKAGAPCPGNARLIFCVPDLDAELARLRQAGVTTAGPLRVSPEGYRAVRLIDPDGHGVELFEWANPEPGSDHVTRYDPRVLRPATAT